MVTKVPQFLVALAFILGVVIGLPSISSAEVPKSTNYQFDETSIGSGGMLQSSSASFKVTDGIGDIGIGNASSAGYNIIAGSHTTHEPTLSFVVNQATQFDTFSATKTSTATASFSVLNYTSFGYVVQIYGKPPTHDGHTLPGMDITGSAQPGIEQFGMNMVANTLPKSFGANPDNGQFGFGSVANTEYGTANSFRYVSGEVIAEAPKESGQTNYTISFIANVASLTPGGTYRANQSLIVTGTY